MFLLGFTLGLIISILCFVVYLVIENSMLKRDLLDAVEELGRNKRVNKTNKLTEKKKHLYDRTRRKPETQRETGRV